MKTTPDAGAHSREEIIAKVIDMERESDREIDRLVDLKQEIRQVIGAVEDPILQTLLELQYLSFRSWPEIIQTMGYSRSTIWSFRKAALEAVKVPESCKFQKVGTV